MSIHYLNNTVCVRACMCEYNFSKFQCFERHCKIILYTVISTIFININSGLPIIQDRDGENR